MEINILWIIVVFALICGGIKGFRQGLVEGAIRIVSCILGIAVLIVLAKGIGSFVQGSMINVLMALILLVAIRIIHRLLRLLLDSCKLVSRLPLVKWLDKFAGTILGMIETVCLIWICFILFGYFDFLNLNTWLQAQIYKSEFLTLLYQSNYIIKILRYI